MHALYACDGGWWDEYYDDVKANYHGPLWTQDEPASKQYGLNYIPSKPGIGLDTKTIVQGSNSGYQCINLAWLWGAKTVLLLGYDMQHTGGKTHWHGNHRGRLGNFPAPAGIIKQFEKMEPEKYGLHVINCSRVTALHCFEKMLLEKAIEQFGIKKTM